MLLYFSYWHWYSTWIGWQGLVMAGHAWHCDSEACLKAVLFGLCRACNLISFSPCLTGPVDYLFASHYKGPRFKSSGGVLMWNRDLPVSVVCCSSHSHNKEGRAIWMRITAGIIVQTLSTICISSKFLLIKEFFIMEIISSFINFTTLIIVNRRIIKIYIIIQE
jgi:hypothetical protein